MKMVQTVLAAMTLGILGSSLALAQAPPPAGPPQPMGFFITSVTLGKGGDLGGLAGADAHCQKLAEAVGAGNRTWRAYLSTQGPGAVNAKDRIGKGQRSSLQRINRLFLICHIYFTSLFLKI